MNIEVVSPEQAAEILALIESPRSPNKNDSLFHLGVEIKGFFDVCCRNEDGSIDWEVHQPNLLTDFGRRAWMRDNIATGGIFTSGVGEQPLVGRYSLFDSVGSSQAMNTNTAPAGDWNAWTKTWSTTFGVPASNRQISAVGLLCYYAGSVGWGATGIMCYSLLTPTKVQTTSQSLEISYRLTLQPGV